MTPRSKSWPLNLARDAISKFLTFVREHYLFVEVAPPAFFAGYGLERPQLGGEAATDLTANVSHGAPFTTKKKDDCSLD